MKNKKLIIGILALTVIGAGYYFWIKKKKGENMGMTTQDTVLSSASLPLTPATTTEKSKEIVQWLADPTNGVFVIVDGKKYGFMNEKAFTNYGYSIPKAITEIELKAIPSGGFVDETGKIINV